MAPVSSQRLPSSLLLSVFRHRRSILLSLVVFSVASLYILSRFAASSASAAAASPSLYLSSLFSNRGNGFEGNHDGNVDGVQNGGRPNWRENWRRNWAPNWRQNPPRWKRREGGRSNPEAHFPFPRSAQNFKSDFCGDSEVNRGDSEGKEGFVTEEGIMDGLHEALLVVESRYSAFATEFAAVMEMARFPFAVESAPGAGALQPDSRLLACVSASSSCDLAVVIFERASRFLSLPSETRDGLLRILSRTDSGLLLFHGAGDLSEETPARLVDASVSLRLRVSVHRLSLHPESAVKGALKRLDFPYPDPTSPSAASSEAAVWTTFEGVAGCEKSQRKSGDRREITPVLLAEVASGTNAGKCAPIMISYELQAPPASRPSQKGGLNQADRGGLLPKEGPEKPDISTKVSSEDGVAGQEGRLETGGQLGGRLSTSRKLTEIDSEKSVPVGDNGLDLEKGGLEGGGLERGRLGRGRLERSGVSMKRQLAENGGDLEPDRMFKSQVSSDQNKVDAVVEEETKGSEVEHVESLKIGRKLKIEKFKSKIDSGEAGIYKINVEKTVKVEDLKSKIESSGIDKINVETVKVEDLKSKTESSEIDIKNNIDFENVEIGKKLKIENVKSKIDSSEIGIDKINVETVKVEDSKSKIESSEIDLNNKIDFENVQKLKIDRLKSKIDSSVIDINNNIDSENAEIGNKIKIEDLKPKIDSSEIVFNHSSVYEVETARIGKKLKIEASTRNLGAKATERNRGIDSHRKVKVVEIGSTGSQTHWVILTAVMDALRFCSGGKIARSSRRLILVDVDDIFVGKEGARMNRLDVSAMIETQERLRTMVKNFTFNLGFSGRFYHMGTDDENLGDEALLRHRHKFWWFPHMWSHGQPHLYHNATALAQLMLLNREFAREQDIPVTHSYAVSPHHSGVFPVHEPLYESWDRVWGIRVSSTEEYPHLKPARNRRGFVHRGIKVLPRQTCGLFTHTVRYRDFPGGPAALEDSIQGGELYNTVLLTPVNIFMTHLSNYGSDRLGLYTFESLLTFITCYTNLKLSCVPPPDLAEAYFKTFPKDRFPLWQNPCNDRRHKDIWSKEKTCDQLPTILILGPQKTGTTALYTFLRLHGEVVGSFPSASSFEEIQFFSSNNNYLKGIDWYMQFFPSPSNVTSSDHLVDKSANYFDSEASPERAHSLLPRARIVVLLTSPGLRAYSWYQHQKAHNDPAALNNTFYQVVSSTVSSSAAIGVLRNRCLLPGLYARHIENWLKFYPPGQLLILDGSSLRTDPVTLMNTLQKFLGLNPVLDFTGLLKFDPEKGFWCLLTKDTGRTRCLGKSKGRSYPEMDAKSRAFLEDFYLDSNRQLLGLLARLGQPPPAWLGSPT